MNGKNEPWDQLEDESALAFGLFRLYLELGTDRSREKVIETSGRHAKLIHKVAHKFRWTKRARAYDRFLTKTEEDAVKKTLTKKATNWALKRSEFRDTEFSLAEQLIAKAKEILAMPLTRVTTTEHAGKNIIDFETGERYNTKIVTTVVEPIKFSLRDAPVMIETASKLARLSAGMETERKLFGFDITTDKNEMIQLARKALVKFREDYVNHPDILAQLPQWIMDKFEIDEQDLMGIDGAPLPPDTQDNTLENDSVN